MDTILWRQSDIHDPYAIYAVMLQQAPVYWDRTNRAWGIYSYEDCLAVLNSSVAHIPGRNAYREQGLSGMALELVDHLARLGNGLQHTIARQMAMLLFEQVKTVNMQELIEGLLPTRDGKKEMDWIDSVCKKLPAKLILKSFGFNDEECRWITGQLEQLVKIMIPASDPGQVEAIDRAVTEVVSIVEKRLRQPGYYTNIIETISRQYTIDASEAFSYAVSNLAGLLIQSYDACRGLLGNSLLSLLRDQHDPGKEQDVKEWVRKSVVETLRFDPPVHHTKRIAVEDLLVNGCTIGKGDMVIVMLASANRDPAKFANPGVFDISRGNNNEHLAFGKGAHMCVANHFSVQLATETLTCFLNRYRNVQLLENEIGYEPLMNLRIPRRLLISFS